MTFCSSIHVIEHQGATPILVDVEEDTLNIDESKIEAAITPQTTAIMPVHVYGHPCDVDRIQKIADNYGLKVIYDAAHAFGVQCHGGSVLNHGDLSVLSFHATKVFTTFEGGAIVCPDAKTKQRVDHLKNFGYVDETIVVAPGINGKMNEFSAALGLLHLGVLLDPVDAFDDDLLDLGQDRDDLALETLGLAGDHADEITLLHVQLALRLRCWLLCRLLGHLRAPPERAR